MNYVSGLLQRALALCFFANKFTRVHKEYRLILYNKRNERRYETNVKHMGRGQHEKENNSHQFYNDYKPDFGSNSMRAKI